MKLNRKTILLFTVLFILLIGITAVSAVSDNSTTVNTDIQSITTQSIVASNSTQTITNDNNVKEDSVNQNSNNKNTKTVQEITDKQSKQSDQKSITPTQTVTKKTSNNQKDIKVTTDNTGIKTTTDDDTIYINASYTGTNQTGTQLQPYSDINNGFTQVNNETNTKTNVYIADGTYNVTNTIILTKNLSITGQSQNNTIISGQNQYQLFKINNVNVNVSKITFANSGGNNKGGAIDNQGNLILTNTTFSDNTAYYGGSIFNRGNISIINSLFNNNVAETVAGVIYVSGNTKLVNSSFTNSKANYYGGVFYAENIESITIDNCVFVSNNAYSGSNFYIKKSNLLINNSKFINSTVTKSGSIYLSDSAANIDNTLFENNTAYYESGALYVTSSTVTVNNSKFFNNTSLKNNGGSIYSFNSTLNIDNSKLVDNTAYYYGGAIHQLEGNLILNNDSFINNKAIKYDGGAIYVNYPTVRITTSEFLNNTASGNGGAIYTQTVNMLNINSSSFINNTANNGGALCTLKTTYLIKGNVFLNNKQDTVYSKEDYLSNLDENWWGQNNPEFTNMTKGIIPDSWIVMTFTNTTSMNNTNIGLKVTLNTLNTGETTTNVMPERNVTFTATTGTFTNNSLPITSVVNNTYTGKTSDIYATIDNQTLKLSNKITPTITTQNIQTYYNSTITITANINKDATGLACIKINGKTIVTNLTVQNGIITYTYNVPTTWKNTNYTITIKYSGNSKYQNSSVNSILTITKQEIKEDKNITITPIITNNNRTYITIPTSYDLRDYGLVTPVKNQNQSGSCWSFSACATLESNLLKEFNLTCDLSENNMKNIASKYSLYGLNYIANDGGGNAFTLISYLVSWLGPVNETQDPYYDLSVLSPVLNSTLHIQDVMFIPNRQNSTDNDQIKEAILQYGAVKSSIFMEDGMASIYYNDVTHAYYYNDNQSISHEITIVGWDDNYDKSNFVQTPPGNGAFIIKNSWGTDWGENGYCYVSYYDTSLGRAPEINNSYINKDMLTALGRDNCVFIFNNTENYLNNYQYDYVDSYNNLTYNSKELWIANQYTAKTDENIAAFGTYFLTKSDYTAYVYVNDKLQYTQNGTTDIGYKTIKLNKYIPLKENDTFKVEVKLNSQTENNIYIIIAGYNENENNNISSLITTKANQSFVSKNGIDWEDLHYNTNPSAVCLKVYTVQTPNMTTSINATKTKAGDSILISTKINDTNIKTGKVVFKLNGITLKDSNGNPIKVNLINGEASINYTIPTNLSKTNYTLTTLLVTKDKRIEQNTTLTLQQTNIKTSIKMAIKQDSTITVNNYTELVNAIDLIKQDTTNTNTIINLNKGNYTTTIPIIWGNSTGTVRNLTINGNNQTINGDNLYNFITISEDYTLNLNEINIINSNKENAIINYGTLNMNNSYLANNNKGTLINLNNCTVTNTQFINNKEICAVTNTANLTVINCSFNSNIINERGAAIQSHGILNIINSSFSNNNAYIAGAIDAEGTLNIISSSFNNNTAMAGGAIALNNGIMDIYNSSFCFNNATDYWGGVLYGTNLYSVTVDNSVFSNNGGYYSTSLYVSNCSSVTVSNSNFTDNKGDNYGSIYLEQTTADLSNLLFSNNTVTRLAGCIGLLESTVSIDSSIFNDNTAIIGGGGAIHSLDTTLTITNSILSNNKGFYGGAIAQLEGSLTLTNVTFVNNKATNTSGGAIYTSYPSITIDSSNFINNTANINGGAISTEYIDTFNIKNSSFINNSASNGGAISTFRSKFIIKNNIFINNTVYLKENYLSNLDENWWGQNNPNFTNITKGITPDTWIVMTFTNTTSINKTNIGVKVTLNTLNTGETTTDLIPERNVTFTTTAGTFTNNSLPITSVVNNTYTGTTKDIYATIDNQTLKLSDKITPTITTQNIQTYNNSTITITANINKDATGLACIKINGKTIVTNLTVQDGIITYTYNIPTNWKNTNYTITIKYSGNNKYINNTINAILTLTKLYKNNITQNNITIIPITTKTNNTNITIPEKYDLRDYGYVTPVRNQEQSNSCWTFGAMGALESDLLKQLNLTYDLSENNLKNIAGKYSLYGLNKDPNRGGNQIVAISYLASWVGPVNETQDPFYDTSVLSPILNSTQQIQDAILIPSRLNSTDNDQIKEAILKYGAITTGFNMDQSGLYYNEKTYAYYYNGNQPPDHATTIVGWDDNYDKSNFLITPPGNGAFICKNSWGTQWGENGYFYISYYDVLLDKNFTNINDDTMYIGNLESYSFIFNNTEKYLNNYQYDYISCNLFNIKSKELWIANQYTAKTDENIAAFGTFFFTKTNYTAYVYVNDKLQYTQNGTTDIGYKTIKLNKYIPLTQNDTFKVELKLNSQTKYNVTVIIAGPNNDTSIDSHNLITKANQSFVSKNGIDWEDLNYDKNPSAVCLKVYTVQTPNMTTSINATKTKAGDSILISTKINDTNIKTGKVVFKLNGITLKDSNGNPIKVNLINGEASINYTIPTNLSKTNYTLTTVLVTNDKRIEQNTTLALQK